MGRFAGSFLGLVFLLSQNSVQQELKLTPDQVAQVTKLSEEQRASFEGLRDLDREERQAKMSERMAASEAAVAKILSGDQLKRLRQIALQQQGARALANEQVAKDLGLTSEQQEKVRGIEQEARQEMRRGGGAQGGDRAAARERFETARKATEEKLMGVLTAEQATKFKELQGEPFKGEIRRPEFRGRRPQGAARGTSGLGQFAAQLLLDR